METTNQIISTNHIFYLKYGEILPEDYFHLSRFFSAWNITLVPITSRELLGMSDSNQRQYVLSVVPDMTKRKAFNQLRKKWLEFALLNKRFCLYDVTSFAKFDTAYQAERIKMYHHFKLPIDMEELAESIAIAYYEDKSQERNWPGGRRAKLPTHMGEAS